MYYEVTLHGVEEGLTDFYHHVLDDLLDQVPSEASLYSTIRNISGKYIGILNIFSEGARFVAKAIGKSPQELMNTLVEQIQGDIKKWHRTRFAGETPTTWYKESPSIL